MEKKVFRSGGYLHVLSAITVSIIIFYVTYQAFESPYVHFIWIVFIIYIIGIIKNRVIIKHGVLHFKTGTSSEEILLADVSTIMLERIYTNPRGNEEGKYKLYVNVLDEANNSVFKFPFTHVKSRKNKQSFIETVHEYNPEIDIDLNTNFNKFQKFVEEYKNHQE